MSKILFLHGFYASGECPMSQALKEGLIGFAEVISPDLPIHPHKALAIIRDICTAEHPDIIVGNSCGAFYAQIIATERNIPAILGNPHFEMSRFVRDRIGIQHYKSPRADGISQFVIEESLSEEFYQIESIQFDNWDSSKRNLVWGLFGEKDTLAHYEPLFRRYYDHVEYFPGDHTPTKEETKTYYVKLVKQLLSKIK